MGDNGLVLRRLIYPFLLWAGLLAAQTARVDSYRVVATYPHDRGAFTEGLEYVEGRFYEGTGMNGHSDIRIVTPATGVVVKKLPLLGTGKTDYVAVKRLAEAG